MRVMTVAIWGAMGLSAALGLGAQSVNVSERAAAKQILTSAIRQVKARVNVEEETASLFKRLIESGDQEIDKIADDIKVTFAVDRLDQEGAKHVQDEIKKVIDEAALQELTRGQTSSDAKVSLKLCWLWRNCGRK